MSWRRIVGVWVLLLPFMIANGVFRELVLVPALGMQPSAMVSAALGIIIVLAITRPFLRHASDASAQALWRISGAWLVLTVGFEFLFGHYVEGRLWSELAENYAVWNGRPWPFVLASLVAAPFIWRNGVRVVHGHSNA